MNKHVLFFVSKVLQFLSQLCRLYFRIVLLKFYNLLFFIMSLTFLGVASHIFLRDSELILDLGVLIGESIFGE